MNRPSPVAALPEEYPLDDIIRFYAETVDQYTPDLIAHYIKVNR